MVAVGEVLEGRRSVPVGNGHLAQQLVSNLPALHVGRGKRTRLHNPRQEQVERRHKVRKRGCGISVYNANTTVVTKLWTREKGN